MVLQSTSLPTSSCAEPNSTSLPGPKETHCKRFSLRLYTATNIKVQGLCKPVASTGSSQVNFEKKSEKQDINVT